MQIQPFSDPKILKDLIKLAKSVARSKFVNSVFNEEDVSQELIIKVLEVLPTMELVTAREIFAMAKTIMKHELIDIIRHQSRRPDTSHFVASLSETDDSWIDVIESQFNEMSDAFLSHGSTTEQICDFYQLRGLITEWAKGQNFKTQHFIREAIEPSTAIQNQWEELQRKSFRYRGNQTIPPFTLARLLGLSNTELYHIIVRLKKFLNNRGYNLSLNCAY